MSNFCSVEMKCTAVLKDASEPESRSARAWAVKPLGPWMITWQVISNTFHRLPLEKLLVTFSAGVFERSTFAGLGAASCSDLLLLVSQCNNVWCVQEHFLHLWDDWHCLAKCLWRRQFIHRLCFLTIARRSSWGSDWNVVQAYMGCESLLHAAHLRSVVTW